MLRTYFFALLMVAAGCGGSTPAAQQPVADAPPAQAPPAAAGPAPLDVVINELKAIGWQCWPLSVPPPPTLQCAGGAPNDQGYLFVYYNNVETGCTQGECVIQIISYEAQRAFGKPCATFTNAMSDLADPQQKFTVSCNDTTADPSTSQQFGFTTTIPVADVNNPGVAAVVPAHRLQRLAAIKKLIAIKAIQR
jgi:hypothetical protein